MNSGENEPRQQTHSVKHFAKEALHDLVHFDSKLFKTVKPLIFKPGFLTTEAFTPAQDKYVKPLALFIFLNFLFFIFKSRGLFAYGFDLYNSISFFKPTINAAIAASHLPVALFAERFNTSMKFEQQEYVIIMVPLFALFINLVYLQRKQYYTEHLVFTLHVYSFAVIFLLLLPPVALLIAYIMKSAGSDFNILTSETLLDSILFIIMGTYLYAALKRVYKQPVLLTLLKTFLSTAFFFFLIVFVYRFVMFYVVMHSLHE